MKKIILLLCFIYFSLVSFSQTDEKNTPPGKNSYLQKSKSQKTTAWVLLGLGGAVDIVAVAVYPWQGGLFLTDAEKRKENTALWLFGFGTASMLSSIPFFISGHINKKKALSMTVNTQQMRQLSKGGLYSINYPAITIKIRL